MIVHTLRKDHTRDMKNTYISIIVSGISVPEVLLADLDNRILVMEEVMGVTLRQHVKQLETQSGKETHAELERLATSLGQLIGKGKCICFLSQHVFC